MAWSIDPAHTSISIAAKHMMVTTVRGTFAVKDGEISVDEANPENSYVRVVIDAASVSTGNEQRDSSRAPHRSAAATRSSPSTATSPFAA